MTLVSPAPVRQELLSNLKSQNDQNKNSMPESHVDYGICGKILIAVSFVIIIATLPISIWHCIKMVQEYERAVIFRLGRLQGGDKGPGLFFIIPCTDEYRQVDLRTRTFDVPPQEILTRDSVSVAMDAVVYYRVNKPILSVVNVNNVDGATRLLAQTTLRNMLGTRSLFEVLNDRENIQREMLQILDEATDAWGIRVERIEIKDVRLPVQLQRAMAAEAEAAREAKAKVIAAEGEKNASIKLKQAADIMSSAPNTMKLRYLQTLTAISAEKNSTVVLPIPLEFFKKAISV